MNLMVSEKKHMRRQFNFKACFIVVLTAYMIIAICGQQSKIDALGEEIGRAHELIEDKQTEASLVEDKEKVYRSDEFIERVARERLGFVRADETVFVDITGK